METLESPEENPPLSNRARRWLLTGALAAGLAIGGAAVANAQTTDSTTPDATTPETVAPDTTNPAPDTQATPREGCPEGRGDMSRGAPPGADDTAPQSETEGSATAI
jgi:hypothetical protein